LQKITDKRSLAHRLAVIGRNLPEDWAGLADSEHEEFQGLMEEQS